MKCRISEWHRQCTQRWRQLPSLAAQLVLVVGVALSCSLAPVSPLLHLQRLALGANLVVALCCQMRKMVGSVPLQQRRQQQRRPALPLLAGCLASFELAPRPLLQQPRPGKRLVTLAAASPKQLEYPLSAGALEQPRQRPGGWSCRRACRRNSLPLLSLACN